MLVSKISDIQKIIRPKFGTANQLPNHTTQIQITQSHIDIFQYCCFVDFNRAFDPIQLDKFLDKFQQSSHRQKFT